MNTEDTILRDLQRKIGEDVVKSALRVLDLMSNEHYLALSLHGSCAMLEMAAQLIEADLGFDRKARPLTVYLVALMTAHAYAQREPVTNEALLTRARNDMHKLGLIPPRSSR
ncbi:hypothetical protein WDM22_38680 [Bradyrhizobium septentrionale]|uniref:hypothetical protein n=1 Tax=Bradyrhizobium septentrionale TaxID=1404411 RepID=UPI0030D54525